MSPAVNERDVEEGWRFVYELATRVKLRCLMTCCSLHRHIQLETDATWSGGGPGCSLADRSSFRRQRHHLVIRLGVSRSMTRYACAPDWTRGGAHQHIG